VARTALKLAYERQRAVIEAAKAEGKLVGDTWNRVGQRVTKDQIYKGLVVSKGDDGYTVDFDDGDEETGLSQAVIEEMLDSWNDLTPSRFSLIAGLSV
jgi:hypothetical protein